MSEYEIRYVNGNKIAGRMNLILSLAGRDLGESMLSRVVQGSYNAGGVSASAGTHDGGGAVDLSTYGWTPTRRWQVLTALRKRGLIAWFRPELWQYGKRVWPDHIHAIDRGARDLSLGARNQVYQFSIGKNGLANQGPDDGPKVPVPNFNYAEGLVDWEYGGSGKVRMATWNCPHRLDPTGTKRRAFIRNLIAQDVLIICLQEVTDAEARSLFPDHWRVHRPSVEQSSVLAWDNRVFNLVDRGQRRLHRLIADRARPRYAVWGLLANRFNGKRGYIAAAHLPAFKDERPRAYRYSVRRLSFWMGRGGDRIVGMDANGNPTKGTDMNRLKRVANVMVPLKASGPMGQEIDHFWRKKGFARPEAIRMVRDSKVSDHAAVIVEIDL